MKFSIKNLGPVRQADFELGKLTVLCGQNGTGKFLVAYAVHGFLHYLTRKSYVDVPDRDVRRLLDKGSLALDLDEYASLAEKFIRRTSREYVRELAEIMAMPEKMVRKCDFLGSWGDSGPRIAEEFEDAMGIGPGGDQLAAIRSAGSDRIEFRLSAKQKMDADGMSMMLGIILRQTLLRDQCCRPFMLTSGRAGAAMLSWDIMDAASRWLEKARDMEEEDIAELDGLIGAYCPSAVRFDLDTVCEFEQACDTESHLAEDRPELFGDFADIVGGESKVAKDGAVLDSLGDRGELVPIEHGPSALRSLFALKAYMRHSAWRDSILIIEEPELHLHPEHQRKVARILAGIANSGPAVLLTTQSETIVRELDMLAALHGASPKLRALAKRAGYADYELLDPTEVRAYEMRRDDSARGKPRRGPAPCAMAPVEIGAGARIKGFDDSAGAQERLWQEIADIRSAQ